MPSVVAGSGVQVTLPRRTARVAGRIDKLADRNFAETFEQRVLTDELERRIGGERPADGIEDLAIARDLKRLARGGLSDHG